MKKILFRFTRKIIKYISFFQICGALAICLCEFNVGVLVGYPTKALPQFKNETDIQVNLDENEGSLFAALLSIMGKPKIIKSRLFCLLYPAKTRLEVSKKK